MGITSLAQHRAILSGLQEGGLLWPGWFVPLTGSFIAIRGLVPAWNSVPLASNSQSDRSVTTAHAAASWPRPARRSHPALAGGVLMLSRSRSALCVICALE